MDIGNFHLRNVLPLEKYRSIKPWKHTIHMPTPRKKATGKSIGSFCQIIIVLLDSDPPIWRRLIIPTTANLGWLHAAVQLSMGWTNSHLHQFLLDEKRYSCLDHDVSFGEEDPDLLDERKFTIGQLLPSPEPVLIYEYDFGDSWMHAIKVEKVLESKPAADRIATCIEGARACPPDDCGGVWGYMELLKALKNRKHPDHKHMKEWVGGRFDAEAFDMDNTNLWLGNLKWPHTTEAQLRKILMARDGYRE